jgi:hypothetical protein
MVDFGGSERSLTCQKATTPAVSRKEAAGHKKEHLGEIWWQDLLLYMEV